MMNLILKRGYPFYEPVGERVMKFFLKHAILTTIAVGALLTTNANALFGIAECTEKLGKTAKPTPAQKKTMIQCATQKGHDNPKFIAAFVANPVSKTSEFSKAHAAAVEFEKAHKTKTEATAGAKAQAQKAQQIAKLEKAIISDKKAVDTDNTKLTKDKQKLSDDEGKLRALDPTNPAVADPEAEPAAAPAPDGNSEETPPPPSEE